MNSLLKRIVVVLAWAAAVIGWLAYQRSTGLGTIDTLEQFIDFARGAWWAPFVFVAVYAIRPVVLFPATLMTIAGGLLFGPVLGIVTTVIGANASALVAYWLARSLGFETADDDEATSLIKRWSARMRNESFVTVMLMRLAFLPYDVVNYAAGILRIRPGAFLAATALGSLPGTISFSLAGASIESLQDGPSGIDSRVLIASVVIFVVSVVVSKFVKQSERSTTESQDSSATTKPAAEEPTSVLVG